jgi:HSP20 family molecular chaperone IbpA/ribosome-associated toxin RatA of RatAB toxin-antitoxin module
MMAKLEKSVEVNVPVRAAYNQMTQFEQYPRFMEGVQEVKQVNDTHLHWHTKSDGQDTQWDSEITEQVPDKMIAWRNVSGKKNTGRVEFQPVDKDKTRITLTMEFEPEGTAAQGKDAAKQIEQRTEQDLSRFKKLIESLGRESGEWRGEVHGSQVQGRGETHQRGELQERQYAQEGGRQQSGALRQLQGDAWFPRMSEVWEEPFVVMRKMTQEMDQFFERMIGRPLGMPRWAQTRTNWTPQVEVAERENQVVVCADLPGIRPEDVHIEVRHDKLKIEGERHEQRQSQDQEFRRSERVYGHFYREISLPDGVDPDAAAASMHDGVLEITVPVVAEKKHGRRVDIRAPR